MIIQCFVVDGRISARIGERLCSFHMHPQGSYRHFATFGKNAFETNASLVERKGTFSSMGETSVNKVLSEGLRTRRGKFSRKFHRMVHTLNLTLEGFSVTT